MKIQAFDYSVNLLKAILWQYNDALRLQGLLEAKQGWYDINQSAFWSNWYVDVFDLRTANDFGLAVWAVILGVPLAYALEDDPSKPIFGFASDDSNFVNSNFAATASALVLTTEQKRLVLRLRYYQLTIAGNVTQTNQMLADVFGGGAAYVADSLRMKIRYVFNEPLAFAIENVLTTYDILPRPAGVGADLVIIGDADGWGFDRYHENFTNGNFYHV